MPPVQLIGEGKYNYSSVARYHHLHSQVSIVACIVLCSTKITANLVYQLKNHSEDYTRYETLQVALKSEQTLATACFDVCVYRMEGLGTRLLLSLHTSAYHLHPE